MDGRRRRGIVAAALVIGGTSGLALAACGGGDGAPSPAPGSLATPAPAPPPAPSPTPAPGATPRPSLLSQADARIGPCINVGNHLEAPNEGDWGRRIRANDMAEIAARGFETIRLPVRWSNHAATTAPYTIEPAFMDRVEQVVDQARAAGLRVILNVHHYEDPQGDIFANPLGQAERFAMMWRQIAQRFRTKDAGVWFELLNEPHRNLNHSNLLGVLGPALAEVRATNPTRPVLWGGENWSNTYSLADLPLPDDSYIVATFHLYEPFSFTHQGAPWINPVLPTGVTYGSTGDAAALAADVRRVTDFMARTGRPVVLGEYGVYEGVPLAERVKYYGAVHDAYRAANVDGCVWAYTNTMYFRDPATDAWIEPLLDAIGL